MQVAFAITGTRWGGPRFLRLTTPRRVAGRRAADLQRAEGHLQTIIGMIDLELAQQLQAIVASCAHLYERSLINPSQFQTETPPATSNVYGWL